MMRLSQAMGIPRGVTAVVGGGGKTSLIWRLACELSEECHVLIATTTRIWPPDCPTLLSPARGQLVEAFRTHRLVAVGDPTPEGKLAMAWALEPELHTLADVVLVEADGSRGLPLKAPAEHEPVLPRETALTIAVAGMSCEGCTVAQAAHRPQRYAALAGLTPQQAVTPEAVANVLANPDGQRKGVRGRFAVLLNQVDTPARLTFARAVAAALEEETFLTALQQRPEWVECWQGGRRR